MGTDELIPGDLTMDDAPTWDECKAMLRIADQMQEEGVAAEDWEAELWHRMQKQGLV